MRKLLWLLSVVVLSAFMYAPTAHASTQDFTIQSFNAQYNLRRNQAKTSTLTVTETITAQFPDYDQNHGLLRSIPQTYQNHTVSLDLQSVTNEKGQQYQYSTSEENDNLVLKIGDPNRYVHGLNTYVIRYNLKNVINFQDDDEFYWDVNGDQWPQAMQHVSATLIVESGLTSSLLDKQVCYTGKQGSQAQNCQMTRSSDDQKGETTVTVQATNLNSYENLTFVTAFKKGTFALGPEVAAAQRAERLKLIAFISGIALPPIVTCFVMWRKWYRYGRDPKGKGVIIPEYVSPKGLSVVASGYILKMNLEPKTMSAALIELAVAGYIRINELKIKKILKDKTDYELEIIKDISQLPKEQKDILSNFFDSKLDVGSKQTVSAQKNKLFTTMATIAIYLSSDLTAKGYFAKDPKIAQRSYYGIGTVMVIAGFGAAFLHAFILIGLIPAGLIVFGFSNIMPARSQKGVETRDYLLGLQEYIQMAEAERLRYLQSPQGAEKRQIDPNDPKQQVKLFEDLLPYAMLFGQEKEWAKQFQNLYSQPPSWYHSTTGNFNTLYLANSLNSFNSANAVAFTAPSSSSSSGFGGGGFSGGGGGGGGGGGW